MEEGLVSIITPCFNGERYVEEFFNSILNQTYPKIEVIFVNDGSTDGTEKIAKKYEKKFEEKGYNYTYIYQSNAGQAAALNKGLKIFKGEFLTWPDADDILYRDSIEKRVEFLKENIEYDLVRNEVNVVDFDTGNKMWEFKLNKDNRKDNIFEDLIFGKNVFYAPVSYMVRTKKFLEINPKREIFETRYGQNWQMLLPISYKSKCGYIDRILCDYRVRKDSHSRIKLNSLKEEMYKAEKHIEILQNVLEPMNLFEIYKKRIYEKYERILLREAYLYNDYNFSREAINKIKEYGKANYKDYAYYYCTKFKILRKIISFFKNK